MKIPPIKGKYLIMALTVPLVLIADQLTKAIAASYLEPLPAEGYLTVIDGFFRLKYTENTGAAWGLFRDASPNFRRPFFIVVSMLAIALIVWFFRKIELKQKLLPLAVSLVLGGAAGNLIDRIRTGRVVDFVDWYITFDKSMNLGLFTIEAGEKHWPTFNIADAAITVGVAMLIIDMFIGRPKKDTSQVG